MWLQSSLAEIEGPVQPQPNGRDHKEATSEKPVLEKRFGRTEEQICGATNFK